MYISVTFNLRYRSFFARSCRRAASRKRITTTQGCKHPASFASDLPRVDYLPVHPLTFAISHIFAPQNDAVPHWVGYGVTPRVGWLPIESSKSPHAIA